VRAADIRNLRDRDPHTLDLNAIPYIKQKTICRSWSIPRTAPASATRHPDVARRGGWARRLLVEVHEKSRRGPLRRRASLYPEGFRNLMGALAPVVQAVGRILA